MTGENTGQPALFRDTLFEFDAFLGTHVNIVSEHLKHKAIQKIFAGRDNRLWLITNQDVLIYDVMKKTFFSPGKLKNLNIPYHQFLEHSGIQKKSGEIFFQSHNGFYYFHPDSIQTGPMAPKIALTGLKIGNKREELDEVGPLPKNITYTGNISLRYDQNDMVIEYAGLFFDDPQSVTYTYQLEPYDEEWIEAGFERSARYTNLPPDQYTFQVKAANADGVWSESLQLNITITPPWYWNWQSKTIYVLATLAALYGFYYWRTREQRKKIIRQEKELAQERRVNKQLKKVDRLKDQFLANTSHELRTPLQGIIGLSESLYEQEDQPEKQENLSMIISSGKRLNNLVNDILDFSKLKNFDIELLQKPLSVHALTDIVLKNNAPLIKGKKLELINVVPADLPAAFADENRLQQVLYNLVGNAIKFTETGHIKVDALQKDEMIQVSVQDTGVGIPVNKQEAIFQEFEQGDGSISREFTGTGLGLSISKRLVELHGGQMWVESDPDSKSGGKGSSFFFTLPVSKGKVASIGVAQPIPQVETIFSPSGGGRGEELPRSNSKNQVFPPLKSPGGGQSPIRILIVDDEPINQQVLKNHLAGKGFQLIQAMNGEEAIKAVENSPSFDLVLLDVMMPRMSGYEVCQKIRKTFLPSELPVIMVTAKNQLQDIVQGLSFGANDYLPKPFHKEELLARINTQLDLHRIFTVAGRFVPNEFLHSLNRERITEVSLGDYTEKEVTVLFTDIRDYTALSETMTPEQNFKFVNAFHGRMGPIVKKYKGFVNQYLGDAIMAIFPERPENALQAAVEMQKALQKYNVQRQNQNRQALKMGVGLHAGSLIMGVIGDQNRMDAATIADTVNTASRIESLTKYYGASILLSEDSLLKMQEALGTDGRNLEDSFHLRSLGKVQVKGKKEPVGLYECFDGDAPEIAAKKLESIPDFEKGLAHFFAKEFPEAVGAFNQILKINPADYTARFFLNKSSRYTLEGVPEDWTGVEVMTFK